METVDRIYTGKKAMTTAVKRTTALLGVLISGIAALAAFDADPANATADVQSFSISRTSSQAGGHPDVELSATFNTKEQSEIVFEPGLCFCSDPKRLAFHFPEGFIGNPHAIPKCSLAELGLEKCPPASQVGLTSALLGTQPLYNMEPRPGEAGLVASRIPLYEFPVFNVLGARTDSDYGLDSVTSNIFHPLGLAALTIWLWGVPTDPVHDPYRAPVDQQGGCFAQFPQPCLPSPVPAAAPERPYLQNPTSCVGPIAASVDVEYYDHTTARAEDTWTSTTGCDLLGFNPSLTANPTTTATDSPSGIDVNVTVPQTQSPNVPSPSELRSVTVKLPEGFSINPNAADGKTVCADSEGSFGTLDAAHCPETAKIGVLRLESSALPAPIDGAMFLGAPEPGNRYRLFLTADGFDTHVKLAGSVRLDPATGRIEVVFDDLPQSPLEEFDMHIFGAERGLLATPERCGTYTVEAEFEPWAEVLGAQTSFTSFTIDGGADSAPCPPTTRPLEPRMVAGTPDNTAGTFSPFAIKLDRSDDHQNLTGLDVVTPPGFLASLKGVPYCGEAAIAMLSNPAYPGRTEQASPLCSPSSQVGTLMTAAGAGSRPLHTPGKVYLAGPYKSAPLSLLVVVPAVSGPYDLGTIAVRAAVYVDPLDAQISTVSDPLPQILDGIPLRLRSLRVDLDRPAFTLNPTNCDPFSVDAALSGDEGGRTVRSAFYQVANCAALPYEPKLSLTFSGGTNRRGHPAVHAVFTAGAGEANTRRVSVALPPNEQLDNAHLDTICTRVQFAADSCPAGSVLGTAEASTPLLDAPLKGDAILRAGSNTLPDLVLALRGQLDIDLVGRIDSTRKGALRTTFEGVPDAPVSSFRLDLDGGSKGLIINSSSLCGKRPKRAIVTTVGQNGVQNRARTAVKARCGGDRRQRKRGKRIAGTTGEEKTR